MAVGGHPPHDPALLLELSAPVVYHHLRGHWGMPFRAFPSLFASLATRLVPMPSLAPFIPNSKINLAIQIADDTVKEDNILILRGPGLTLIITIVPGLFTDNLPLVDGLNGNKIHVPETSGRQYT
ncbi:hypothetical protein CNMCM5793_005344 [Aspergillus hiratsukae]|uniref:Uncharacterized protein n=1 Tax=Aspergillus hiratsukae TaxID=1194566 RepID=A0A8H6PGB3_9EURO|nr:hypothetical protein CNMCM5793_005344 [Aspergillus hiratsukae]